MIDATATLEQPGALRVRAVIVAPTMATQEIYKAIADSMQDPGHAKLEVKFENGAIVVDLELHTDEHVDHLEALKEAAKNVGKSIEAAGKEVVAATEAGVHAVEQDVENLAHAAHNEANKLIGHQGPGPNEDKGAEANSDPDALGKLHQTPPLDPAALQPTTSPAPVADSGDQIAAAVGSESPAPSDPAPTGAQGDGQQ